MFLNLWNQFSFQFLYGQQNSRKFKQKLRHRYLKNHQNNVIDVVLLSLSLTLNSFHTLLTLFIIDFEQIIFGKKDERSEYYASCTQSQQ